MELSYLHEPLEEGFSFNKNVFDEPIKQGLFARRAVTDSIDMIRDVLRHDGVYGSQKVRSIRNIIRQARRMLGNQPPAGEAKRGLEAMEKVWDERRNIRRGEVDAALAALVSLGRRE